MNYLELLSPFLSRWIGKDSIKLFNRKRSNGGWIWVSILGVVLLGLFGSRNNRVKQEVQKGFQQVKNSFQVDTQRKMNPFEVNYNLATEIAKEINSDFDPATQLPKNK